MFMNRPVSKHLDSLDAEAIMRKTHHHSWTFKIAKVQGLLFFYFFHAINSAWFSLYGENLSMSASISLKGQLQYQQLYFNISWHYYRREIVQERSTWKAVCLTVSSPAASKCCYYFYGLELNYEVASILPVSHVIAQTQKYQYNNL